MDCKMESYNNYIFTNVQKNKIYLAWKKLQDKLDKGGNLSVNEWKKYNQYTEQLEYYAKEKADTLAKMNDDLAEALDPSNKLEQIQKTYEESAEGIYERGFASGSDSH